jgi:sodium-dependent dicarboxylate transporter 2/3/5
LTARDWKTANEAISWDVLLLFGGGLSLASAIQHTGVAQLIGAQVAVLAGSPFPVVLFGVVFIVTFATGVTSNTALAAMMMPLLAAVANALGLPPQPILMGTALAASAAFILPISTPPNAIVFGTGKIKIADMFRAGILINFVAIFVITGVMLLLD